MRITQRDLPMCNISYNYILSPGAVYCCAKMLAELTCKGPIMILKGGYEKFSALYPFLKSQQIIFSPRVSRFITNLLTYFSSYYVQFSVFNSA